MPSYFDYFEMKPSFTIDKGQLKRKFIQLSRESHPDFHTLEDGETQESILARSTEINKAYEVLRNGQKRMKYILHLYDVMGPEGENKLPQAFLMEMMDINETIMDIQMDFDAEKMETIKEAIAKFEATLLADAQPAMDAFDEDGDIVHLEKVKDYYLKHKYLVRIKENLDTFASGEVRM